MSYETISISVEADLKRDAERILSALGLDLETAITMFLQSVVRCGGMPFDTEEAEQEKGSRMRRPARHLMSDLE